MKYFVSLFHSIRGFVRKPNFELMLKYWFFSFLRLGFFIWHVCLCFCLHQWISGANTGVRDVRQYRLISFRDSSTYKFYWLIHALLAYFITYNLVCEKIYQRTNRSNRFLGHGFGSQTEGLVGYNGTVN